ncbi:MAG: hypothetical protein FWC73_07625 [Defluviitaleaceae bacterium]|nr:hypothetical protein [Defluviitaleaceae bacterium]
MAFPLTHLLVADELLTRNPRPEADAAQVLLGSLAPDAVHYRKEIPADMGGIGPIKKISHLCPVSDEPWGKVTDNDGWVEHVRAFVGNYPSPLAEGYAIHCLTDLYNNMTLWRNFRAWHPVEASKGYKSGYYQDLRNIDFRLYRTLTPQVNRIWHLLAMAEAHDMPRLVTADEIRAINENILYVQYGPVLHKPSEKYSYVTYEKTIRFIQKSADFIQEVLP